MRSTKGNFAAVFAVAAVFCGIGAANAMAVPTTLCTMAQEKCLIGNRLGPTEIKASTTQVTFTNTISNITCTSSSFTTKTKVESGEPLPAEISAAPAYGGCATASKEGCSITPVNVPYAPTIAWKMANTASLTLASGGAGEPGLNVACGGLIKCVFSGNIPYEFIGGNGALLEVTGFKFPNLAGGGCPTMAQITTTYGVTAPKPVYPAHT